MDNNRIDKSVEALADKEELLNDKSKSQKGTLLYPVTANPTWIITIMYALQQASVTAVGPLVMAMMVHNALCADDHVLFAQLLSSTFFMSGICTIIQITFGVRLPIKQSSSWIFIGPILAMMTTEQWKCPEKLNMAYNGSVFMEGNYTNVSLDYEPEWKPRLLHVSGGLILASLVEFVLGLTGAVGWLMHYIGPLTVIPIVCMIGLTLYHGLLHSASDHWGIAGMSFCMLLFFVLFLEDIKVPYFTWSKQNGWQKHTYPIFKVFSLIMALGISWLVCYILTINGVFPENPGDKGYTARTDARIDVMHKTQWIHIPYPGQWGWPTFGPAIFIGTLAATLSSIAESIGDYYATAAVCDVPPPPKHALNRGIMMEGLGSMLCGFVGICHGTTSYSDSMSFISLTGMGSRSVWLAMGVLMIIFGVVGKIGAILTLIPNPVIAGACLPILGMIAAVAWLNLKHVNMNKSRNLMILGLSHLMGIAIPDFLRNNPGAVQTGNIEVDQILTVFLSTSTFLAGFVGFVLDNAVPGSREDRGLISFNLVTENNDDKIESKEQMYQVYEIPFIGRFLKGSWSRYIPIFPGYDEDTLRCCKKKDDSLEGAPQIPENERLVLFNVPGIGTEEVHAVINIEDTVETTKEEEIDSGSIWIRRNDNINYRRVNGHNNGNSISSNNTDTV